jgi:hypothetical protein
VRAGVGWVSGIVGHMRLPRPSTPRRPLPLSWANLS